MDEEDFSFLNEYYFNFQNDLKDALQYLNHDSPFLPEYVRNKLNFIDYEVDEEHKEITSQLIDFLRKNKMDSIPDLILRAAYRRKFIG